jgi:hypothetical protein
MLPAPDPIPRAPPPPDNERLKSFEWMYVHEFQSLHTWPYYPRCFRSRLGSNIGVELYQVSDINCHSSKLYRSAVMVLMSYLNYNDASDTETYRLKYEREAQDCINHGNLVDVVFASYLVAVYSILGEDTVQMALKRCQQFCKSVVHLSRIQKSTDPWIELLWRDTLVALYNVHRDTILFNSSSSLESLLQSVAQWEELLQISHCLLARESDIANLPRSMPTETICHKIISLSVYLQVYLDHFLIRVCLDEGAEETKSARRRLYGVVDRITRLGGHLPNISDYLYHAYHMEASSNIIHNPVGTKFLSYPDVLPRSLSATAAPATRDTAVALLYAFAHLLKIMLESTADMDENASEVHDSAIAICRLCANLTIEQEMETLLLKRSLFWAGLVLMTESKLSRGQKPFVSPLIRVAQNWIKSQLQECISTDCHWRDSAIIVDEEGVLGELFQKASECTAINDIWKVNGGNVSLFYYNTTLAPWFVALNLVRFEHKPLIGRSLEIF